jgi:capsular polysaccharide biosynthesis protein
MMLSSSPISYSDIWTTGVSGWIHTSYDTSYIPNGLDWIDQEDFGKHMKVAALSVLRLSTDVDESQPIDPLLSFIPLGIAFLLALVISLILIRRKT